MPRLENVTRSVERECVHDHFIRELSIICTHQLRVKSLELLDGLTMPRVRIRLLGNV